MEDVNALQSPRWKETRAERSPREQRILGDVAAFELRTYILDDAQPPKAPTSAPAAILLESVTPADGAEAEFLRWYNEEHIPRLAQVPGFQRAQRFVLCELGYGELLSRGQVQARQLHG